MKRQFFRGLTRCSFFALLVVVPVWSAQIIPELNQCVQNSGLKSCSFAELDSSGFMSQIGKSVDLLENEDINTVYFFKPIVDISNPANWILQNVLAEITFRGAVGQLLAYGCNDAAHPTSCLTPFGFGPEVYRNAGLDLYIHFEHTTGSGPEIDYAYLDWQPIVTPEPTYFLVLGLSMGSLLILRRRV